MLRVWNYGGGTQTIAIAALIIEGRLPTPDVAIFSDTKDETDDVYEWLEFMRPLLPCELRVVSHPKGSLRKEVETRVAAGRRLDKPPYWTMGDDGREAPMGRDCTREWKVKVIEREIKRLLGIPKRGRWPTELAVEQWLGISIDEKTRMKVSTVPWMRWWHPLIEAEWGEDNFWRPQRLRQPTSRTQCVRIIRDWLRSTGLTPPTQHAPKSACKQCPYRSNALWRQMRDNEPHNWKQAVEHDRKLRSGPGGVIHGMDRPAYVHRSLKPLDEVDLDSEIGSSMDFECSGICGV